MDVRKHGFSEQEVHQLKETFYAQSAELMESLVQQLLELERAPDNEHCLLEIRRVIHTLKGDSRSVGLSSLADLVHRVEDILVPITEKHRAPDQSIIALLFQCADAFQHILQESRAGREDSIDIAALLDQISRHREAPETESSGDSASLTEYARLQIESARQQGQSVYEIMIIFDPRCQEKGVGAFLVTKKLADVGEVLLSEPPVESDAVNQSDHVRLLVVSRAAKERIEESCRLVGVVGDAMVRPYQATGAIQARRSGIERRSEIDRRAAMGPADHVLRVDSRRVDEMMNLVGELMICRSTIGQHSSELEERYQKDESVAQLVSTNAVMERTLSDLQKGVMKIRMVPIDQVFRRFPRVVRDLSHDSGKQIGLEIVGKETELDKSLVDVLSEPILHLVRNAIDHGIESPEVRAKLGKSTAGTVTLKAYHESNQIVIEVGDDGKGIDRDRVRQKVLEKNLIGERDLKKLTEQDVLDLIFLPGLSTAERVTEVSGRGIGMDVVKTTIEKLKGIIQVRSEPSTGTTFVLRLPLTLAIIRAMMFKVGESLFALPVSSIVEITRAAADLETVHGKPIFRLRDRVISLIRMRALFGIEEPRLEQGGISSTRVENNAGDAGAVRVQSAARVEQRVFIIVVGLAEKRIGIVVDELIGEQELVIKPLDDQCVPSKSVAGASILGNGKVVLILDAPSLVHQAVVREREVASTPMTSTNGAP